MRVARALAGCALVTTLVLISSGGLVGQDKKESGKVKGQLPQGWTKLDLTAAQKEEIYKLTAEHREKRAKLQAEIGKLDAELARKRVAVLTDEQKRKLVDLVAPGEGGKTKERTKGKDPQ